LPHQPENVLFTNYDDDADVKITDFGLAQVWHEGVSEPMATSCGSPGYVAPEVLRCKGYGAECDLWSTGVIIYVCLCGFAPFHDDDKQRLLDQIRSGVFSFPDPFWSDISEEAKDFVSRLLVIHPRQRMTATQCLEHPWLSDDAMSDVGSVSPAASEGHDAVLEQVHSNTVPVLGEFVVASPRCLSPVDKLCKSEASVDSDEEKDGMVRAACSSSSGPAGASQARRRLRAAIHAVMLCNSAPSIRKERKLRQLKEMSEKLAAKHHNPMPAEQRDMGS
jgi:serine/threonine protein kinase